MTKNSFVAEVTFNVFIDIMFCNKTDKHKER